MITVQGLLDAIEGVAYVTDADGVVVAVGRPAWHDFAMANGTPALADPAAIVGRSLFDSIQGRSVIEVYRKHLDDLAQGRRQIIEISYRCDSPDYRRDTRMALSAVREGGALVGILFQNIVLSTTMRPAMELFAPHDRGAVGSKLPIVTICSFCLRLPWPQDVAREHADWIEAEEYYRRGGASRVRLSHGLCPDCYERLMRDEGFNPPPYRSPPAAR